VSEQNPAPEQGTPAVGGPEGAAPAEEIDWQARALAAEDRYGHLQPEYTRTTQEAATQRDQLQWYELLVTSEDADIRRQAAEALGFEFEEEQPSEPETDPVKPLQERLDRMEQTQSQRDQEAQDAEYARAMRAVLDERLEELMPGSQSDDGVKFDQDQVLAYAMHALPPAEDGLPDLQGAYDLLTQRQDARQKSWAQSKRAPHISPNGQTGTEVPNLDNDQERQDWMARQLQANEQSY
jgi:hypothetical protein